MQSYEDFISTVSHELRTPLTSIRGFAQTMLQSYDKLDDESKKRFIKIIEEQSNRLMHLSENMLKVQNNENLIFKTVSAKKLIEDVIQIVKQQYKNHKFIFTYNNKLPKILVDTDKFQQVMTNLIENAAKYSDINTTVTVKADFDKNQEFVSIKVIDNGVKIDKKDFDSIFEKFSRIDNPLTRKVQGSGLGLYITKVLVTKMNGEISVDSNDEETVFEIKIPSENIEKQAREKCSQTR